MTDAHGKLIICPTPIGNLGDMSPRALDGLRSCDTVCCEDTRVTGKLLAAFDISKPLERLDEATISQRCDAVLDRVAGGERLAYCSDAGMPGVSDPGQRLIDRALDRGVPVEVIAGPTAVTTAYVASGFTCPRFYFAGFFPRKEGERTREITAMESRDAVTLYYESPHRVVAALKAIAQQLPDRRVAVCRELTKMYEETARATASELAKLLVDREREAPIKGEIVIVIDAQGTEERAAAHLSNERAAQERVEQLRADGSLTNKDRVRILRDEFGLSRNEAYALVHGDVQ